MKSETIFILLGLGLLVYLFSKKNGMGERTLTEAEKRGYKKGLAVA